MAHSKTELWLTRTGQVAQLGTDYSTEFEKYRVIQDRMFMSDFDRYMLELEENVKK